MESEETMRVEKTFRVVSGGQTGVDRAALDAAMAMDVPVGGWCPRGRRAEDGRIPERYPLREATTDAYAERTRLNVRDSDATLVIGEASSSRGTALTADEASRLGKPLLQVEHGEAPDEVVEWLREHAVRVLNVAGPRESKVPGTYRQARSFIQGVLRAVMPT